MLKHPYMGVLFVSFSGIIIPEGVLALYAQPKHLC